MADRLTTQDLEFALDIVKRDNYSCRTLFRLVKEESKDFDRSYKSLWLLCVRLHVVVHEDLPLNMKENENWFYIPHSLAKFADDQGYNVPQSVNIARSKASKRRPKRSKKAALETMCSFYKANKSWIPQSLKHSRDKIIRDLMEGGEPRETFIKYLTEPHIF